MLTWANIEAIRERARAECEAQGIEFAITDPVALAPIAAALNSVDLDDDEENAVAA